LTFGAKSYISAWMNAVPQYLRRCLAVYLAAGLALAGLAVPAVAQQAGSLDASFELANSSSATVYSVSPQSDGNIVIGGYLPGQIAGAVHGPVTRVKPDGELDASFVPPMIQSYNTLTDSIVKTINLADVPEVFTTAIQADGKILVGGSFYFVNGQPGYGGVIRLNTDGSLDTTFQPPRFNGSIFSVVPLASGKILVGGGFTYIDDKVRNCLAQLESDGTLDKGFDPGAFTGTPPLEDEPFSRVAFVHSIVVGPGGGIVIGGAFTAVGGTPLRGIARLLPGGSVDTSFVPDPGFNPPSMLAGQSADYSLGQVLTLALQSDGKILVGGSFRDPASPTLSQATATNAIYRLDADGSFDPSFNPNGVGTVFESVFASDADPFVSAIVLQPDGRIIIGGPIVGYNGHLAHLVLRLDTDGERDTTFNAGIGPTFTVYALALEPGGKLLVGGSFGAVDNVSRPFVARLNTVANVPPAVVVRIAATKKFAFEADLSAAKFTVTRSGGNPTANLVVSYQVSGTAVEGVDYRSLPRTVTIVGGSDSAVIRVKPKGDFLRAHRKVTVTLVATSAYGLLPKTSASVVIADQQ
jgi:uncharacterized delta-60 repeat protein